MRILLPICAGVILLASGAFAGAWDDSHMTTRYRSLLSEPATRPDVEGMGRYETLAEAPTETPGVRPPATLPVYTQRQWKSGPSRSKKSRSQSTFSNPAPTLEKSSGLGQNRNSRPRSSRSSGGSGRSASSGLSR